MLYTQVKGILQHINFDVQSLFSQRILECFRIFGHCLRIGNVMRLADGFILCAVISSQYKFAVQAVCCASEI